MTLTELLRHRSPLRDWMNLQFPRIRDLSADARLQARQPGGPTVPRTAGSPATTIGIAFDYRVRLWFGALDVPKTAAWMGAQNWHRAESPWAAFEEPALPPADPSAGRFLTRHQALAVIPAAVTDAFMARAERELPPLLTEQGRGGVRTEAAICRWCVGLALFEEVYRAGFWPNSLLFRSGRLATVEALLAAVPRAWIAELVELTDRFRGSALAASTGRYVPNPTFEGSRDVGGADADIIVGDRLIELKVTSKASPELWWLRQLLGYALLDYSDAYALRSIGMYLARSGAYLHWDLGEVLHRIQGADPLDLDTLRRRCRLVVRGHMAPDGWSCDCPQGAHTRRCVYLRRVREVAALRRESERAQKRETLIARRAAIEVEQQEAHARYQRDEAEWQARDTAWRQAQTQVIREARLLSSAHGDRPLDLDEYWLNRLELALTPEFLGYLGQHRPVFSVAGPGGEEREISAAEVAALLWPRLRDSTFAYGSGPRSRTLHDDFVAAARGRRRSFPSLKLATVIEPVLADLMTVRDDRPYLRATNAAHEEPVSDWEWFLVPSAIADAVACVFEAEATVTDGASEDVCSEEGR